MSTDLTTTDGDIATPSTAPVVAPNATSVRHTASVIDLPNLTGHLTELAGGRRGPATRVDFASVADYILTASLDPNEASATVFMQIPERTKQLTGFVVALRRSGFGVFARPQGDIDDNLVDHVVSLAPTLDRLVITTHDRGLLDRCLAAVRDECRVTVLGLSEFSAAAMRNPRVDFVDLGSVTGALSAQLPRCELATIPDGGVLLPPLARMRPLPARAAA